MKLKGSCHCGAVAFTVESRTPYPYLRCYCSVCRKTQGGGGYAINIMGEAATLRIEGKRNVSVYRARLGKRGEPSPARRHFCKRCGSGLWVWDPRWPQWVYPFASAIDTRLPRTRSSQHIMLAYAAPWVEVPRRKGDRYFRGYPSEGIADWHKKRGLYR
jgi:hypothetical protein